MNLPLVMIGSTLVFEDGEGLEEDEAANYALNLEKVLTFPLQSSEIISSMEFLSF